MQIRIALLLSSVALTAVVAGVIFKSSDEEWRGYQLDYYDQAIGLASSEAVRDALADGGLEIKQDVLSEFGEERRVDRCRTCHTAIDDPAFVDGDNPLRTHPEMPVHPFGEFGCTICHEGDGRALTVHYAHGHDHFWNEPLLAAPYIESSCAKCHPEPYLDETPHLRRGRELYDEYGCGGCHSVRGVSRGKLGPELTAVGAHYKVDYLAESMTNPDANTPMSQMPTFHMPDEDVEDLTVYLKSLRGRQLYEDPMSLRSRTREWREESPDEVEVTVEAGRVSVQERACLSCHALGDEDGGLAPDLTYQGLLRSPQWVAQHVADPRSHVPGSSMPSFWTSASEQRAIAVYLESRRDLELAAAPADQYEQLCARCHATDGSGDGPIASDLLPLPREFTNERFFNWLPEERAHTAIAEGVPGTAMPPFAEVLTDAEVEALWAHVRGEFIGERPERKTERKLPDANPVAYSDEVVDRGYAVYQQRCYGCHGRAGDGRGPNAPDMLPRPRDLTSTGFIGSADDVRLYESITYGIVGTGMPPWDYLPETQRWELVHYIRDISGTHEGAEAGEDLHADWIPPEQPEASPEGEEIEPEGGDE